MKKYIELKVIGNKEELNSFITLLTLIKSFGRYGMSRRIEVNVDGDGSGKLDFQVIKSDSTTEDLPTFGLNELHGLEKNNRK